MDLKDLSALFIGPVFDVYVVVVVRVKTGGLSGFNPGLPHCAVPLNSDFLYC